jgi:hypothetical protein
MVAAKIEMVNLRIDSTPSSEHPARLMVTFAEALIGEVPERGVSALTQVWPRPCNYRPRGPGASHAITGDEGFVEQP